jgi:hypothetical protein
MLINLSVISCFSYNFINNFLASSHILQMFILARDHFATHVDLKTDNGIKNHV